MVIPGLSQGDIVKLQGYTNYFLVVSNNAYIRSAEMFHACLMTTWEKDGPLHIRVKGVNGTEGVVSCEQIRLIDPASRGFQHIDRLAYRDLMEVSDAIQGMFEYD